MFKKIFIVSLFLLLLLPVTTLASRPLEVEFPTIPGVETPGDGVGLPQFLEYLYYFAIGITGIIALIAFVWGGFIYLTSAGSPGKMQQGRSRIISGLVGIAIVLGAHLIINTIDPQFFRQPAQPKMPNEGYCLKGYELAWQEGAECRRNWDEEDESSCQDIIGEAPEDLDHVQCCRFEPRVYCYDKRSYELAPRGFVAQEVNIREHFTRVADVHFFSEEDFQGDHGIIHVVTDDWVEVPVENPRSIYLRRWQLGFALFPQTRCYADGRHFEDYPDNYPLYVSGSSADLGDYGGRIRSIYRHTFNPAFFEDSDVSPNIWWTGVFFSRRNFQGNCGIIHGDMQASQAGPDVGMEAPLPCFWVGANWAFNQGGHGGGLEAEGENNIRSAYVVRRNPRTLEEGQVTFYSGVDYSEGGPGHELPSQTISAGDINARNRVSEIWTQNLDYGGGTNGWGQEHILSVKVDGDFLVVLNSEPDFTGDCTIVTRDTPTLFGSFVLRNYRHGARVRSIAIIPKL